MLNEMPTKPWQLLKKKPLVAQYITTQLHSGCPIHQNQSKKLIYTSRNQPVPPWISSWEPYTSKDLTIIETERSEKWIRDNLYSKCQQDVALFVMDSFVKITMKHQELFTRQQLSSRLENTEIDIASYWDDTHQTCSVKNWIVQYP